MQDPLIDEVLSGAYGMERLMDRGGMGAVYAHVGGGDCTARIGQQGSSKKNLPPCERGEAEGVQGRGGR